MAVFNLKKVASDNHADHVEHRLKKEHKPEHDCITEEQLKDYITDEEKHSLTETQLEDNRGGPDGTIEARLNSSTSTLVQHRNEATHIGDINKLEEKRIANQPIEEEEYKPASETPKEMRWWEQSDSPDGLKLAARNGPGLGPARFDAINEDGELSEDFMMDDFDVSHIDDDHDHGDEDDPEKDFFDDDPQPHDDEVFDVDTIEDDEEALKDIVSFREVSYEENAEVEIIRGEVKVEEDIGDNTIAIHDLIDFVVEAHPHLEGSLTTDSLDFSKMDSGIVRYMVNGRIASSSKDRVVQANLPTDIPTKKK